MIGGAHWWGLMVVLSAAGLCNRRSRYQLLWENVAAILNLNQELRLLRPMGWASVGLL